MTSAAPAKWGPLEAGIGASMLLKQMILGGELRQGQRLPPERELATRLAVSRSSVREAIRELVALGALVARQGAGTYVTDLTPQRLFGSIEFALRLHPRSILDVLEIRLLLEPSVAALAATRLGESELAELKAELATYRSEVESDAGRGVLVATDARIHDILLDVHPNTLVKAILRSLQHAARAAREFTVSIPDTPVEGLAELEALVNAIGARDPLAAQSAMTRHISRTSESARKALTQLPDEARAAETRGLASS